MTLRDALDFALTSLRGNLAKSLLTVLGLGVGVGAVLTVLSLGDAGEIRVEEEIARLGVDKVWFCAENPAYPLTEDCRAIAASTGADVCLGASTMDAVSLGGQTVYAQIAGYDDGLEAVHHPSSVQGRMFTAREYSGERVALLDETLAGRLNAAVGDFINCGGRRYCIVGVVAGMPAQSASLGSGMLLLPLQTWQDTYALAPTELALAVPKGEKAGELAEDVLAKLHNLPGKYLSVTLENEVDAAKSVVRIFVMVLACVAFVCVATGAIGVMNVLLISVRERRRENRTPQGNWRNVAAGGAAVSIGSGGVCSAGRAAGDSPWLGDDGALRRADWLNAAGEAAAHGTAAGGRGGAGAELRRDSRGKSGRTSSSAGT